MIAVLVKDNYALLTLLSIRAVCPTLDPWIIYIGDPLPAVESYLEAHHHDRLRTAVTVDGELESIHGTLQCLTADYVLCLTGGMLLFQDPTVRLPTPERMANYSTAVAKRYMYTRRVGNTNSYRAIGIDVSANQHTGLSYHNPSVPFDGSKFLNLTERMCHRNDPLLEAFMNGREVLKHSRDATDAVVADYLEQALDPTISMLTAYAGPLEVYARYAEQLADVLPAEALAAMRKNGKRSAMIAPMRPIIKGAFDF